MQNDNPDTRMYECKHCGQVVQGFNAKDDVECCEDKDMRAVDDE